MSKGTILLTETKDGWTVDQTGLEENRSVHIEFHEPDGIVVVVDATTPRPTPLAVSLA